MSDVIFGAVWNGEAVWDAALSKQIDWINRRPYPNAKWSLLRLSGPADRVLPQMQISAPSPEGWHPFPYFGKVVAKQHLKAREAFRQEVLAGEPAAVWAHTVLLLAAMGQTTGFPPSPYGEGV